jgi:GNAT superfamily N-acetyltransferase
MQISEETRLKVSPRALPDGLEFRLGTVEDVPALVELGKEFFALSQMERLGAEFSETQTEKYLTAAIENGFMHHLLATVDGKVIGGISYYYDASFFKRPLAILNHFFLTKRYRKTAIGRMLVMMAADIAKDEQACAFIMPVNSGSKHIHSLGNLLARSGFSMTGYIMSRSL